MVPPIRCLFFWWGNLTKAKTYVILKDKQESSARKIKTNSNNKVFSRVVYERERERERERVITSTVSHDVNRTVKDIDTNYCFTLNHPKLFICIVQ